MKIIRIRILIFLALLLVLVPEAFLQAKEKDSGSTHRHSGDAYKSVVCLLPGRVRKLGGRMTYIERRKPVETTTADCEIRGGEYTIYNRANYEKALAIWKETAAQGDPKAQTYVGEIYEKRLGKPDYVRAAQWYELAAKQGYQRAMRNLAYLYEHGLGVTADLSRALNLWRRASGLKEELTLASNLVAAKSEADRKIETLTGRLDQRNKETQKLQRAMEESKASLVRNNASLAETRVKLKQIQENLRHATTAGDSSDSKRVSSLEAELHRKEALLEQQDTDIALLNNQLVAQEANLNASISSASIEEQRLAKALADIRAQRDSLLEQLANRDSELQKFKHQIVQENRNLVRKADQVASYRAEISALQKKVTITSDEKTKIDDRVAELEERLRISQREYAAKQLEVSQLKDSLARDTENFRSELKTLEMDRRALSDAIAEKQQIISSNAAVFGDELSKQKSLVGSLRKEIVGLHEEVTSLEAANSTYGVELAQARTSSDSNRIARIDDLRAELARNQKIIADKSKKIDEITQKWSVAQAEIQQLGASKEVLAAEISRTEKKILDAKHDKESLQADLNRLQEGNKNYWQELKDVESQLVTAESSRDRARQKTQSLRVTTERQLSGKNEEIGRYITEIKNLKDQIYFNKLAITDLKNQRQLQVASYRGLEPEEGKFFSPKRNVSSNKRDVSSEKRIELPTGVETGDYYALIIANSYYEYMPTLETPENDTRELQALLEQKYGFTTRREVNLNRDQMYQALNSLKEYKANDNVLIYYAGHGKIDSQGDGYWLPVDYNENQLLEQGAISAMQLTMKLNTMSARHVLLIVDSCYQGAMVRAPSTTMNVANLSRRLKHFIQFKSRNVLTSGGVQPVLDSGSNGHSVFAKALIDVLTRDQDVTYGEAIHADLREMVRYSASQFNLEQTPLFASIADAGDGLGQFVFIPRQRPF